jgi:hypothetical protein
MLRSDKNTRASCFDVGLRIDGRIVNERKSSPDTGERCGFWVVGLRLSHTFKGILWHLQTTSTELYCDVRGEFHSTRKLVTQRNETTEFEGIAVSVSRNVKSAGSKTQRVLTTNSS